MARLVETRKFILWNAHGTQHSFCNLDLVIGTVVNEDMEESQRKSYKYGTLMNRNGMHENAIVLSTLTGI